MITSVRVLPHRDILKIDLDKQVGYGRLGLIYIKNENDTHCLRVSNREWSANHALFLTFEDIDVDRCVAENLTMVGKKFQPEHARLIIKFVDKLQTRREPIHLLVSCQGGSSRSGAVAEFVVNYCNLDITSFEKENKIVPNKYVARILHECMEHRNRKKLTKLLNPI